MKHFFLSVILLAFVACNDTKEEKTDETPQTVEENDSVSTSADKVLVFTKTAGFRHKSIETGVELIKKLGNENDFSVTQTEDSLQFNTENLKKYDLVMFLSTTMDVLGEEQQNAFEGYIQNGGSFMGIHAAADTEYEWPWYGKLVGAYFENHPKGTPEATITVLDRNHVSTKGLPEKWIRKDEWYNYKDINSDINVLMNLEESTYEGGTNGENHPIAWYHEFDGGRAFYTGGGHTKESFEEPLFVEHVLGGIFYCLERE
ncbi:ThuA domain-containing protein [Galbibacter mesophilus]|uniref:ThuA domain-containing protein n=1 Tax=Galbibacter mesophilus TaxID=379069 RepID=UPI00191CB81C|nr:ThuA domain-containing protein [Galbibacter mesophilus]MCM5662354.1 ThuA domain-containing protein [Galbibacter mesophilus]